MIATAESCTGGLVAGALTEIAGSSAVVDRGFVTYSNDAKHGMLGVSHAIPSSDAARSAAKRRRRWRAARSAIPRSHCSVSDHRHCRARRRHGGKAGRACAFCCRTARRHAAASRMSLRRPWPRRNPPPTVSQAPCCWNWSAKTFWQPLASRCHSGASYLRASPESITTAGSWIRARSGASRNDRRGSTQGNLLKAHI